jgi:hypothetical protein
MEISFEQRFLWKYMRKKRDSDYLTGEDELSET